MNKKEIESIVWMELVNSENYSTFLRWLFENFDISLKNKKQFCLFGESLNELGSVITEHEDNILIKHENENSTSWWKRNTIKVFDTEEERTNWINKES
jgi:hypothetical protein